MTVFSSISFPRRLPRWNVTCPLNLSIVFLILVPSTLVPFRGISVASLQWIAVLGLCVLGLMFRRTLPRFSLIPLGIIALPLISTLLNFGALGGTWQGGLINLLGMLLLYILLRPLLTASGLIRALQIIVLLSVPVAVMAALQLATGALPIIDPINQQEFQTSQLAGRISGTLGHPILLGTFSGFVSLLLMIMPNLRFPLIARTLLLSINLAMLWVSGSRSSIIPVVLLGAVLLAQWLWRQFRKKRIAVLHLGTIWSVLLGIWLLAALNLKLDLSRFQNLESSHSYIYRTQQWAGGWEQLSQSYLVLALGNGLGSTVALFSRMKFTNLFGPATFDNAYITLLYECGFLGLISLLLPLLSTLWRGGTGAFFVAFLLLNAFFYDAFRWPVFGLLMVLSILMTKIHKEKSEFS